jgi:hypothetical protein
MEHQDDIKLRIPALKLPYQSPYPDQKTDQIKNSIQVPHSILPQIIESVILHPFGLSIIMAAFINADISNADAAIATRDSAITLLRRLESIKHESKALQCLCDQLYCAANILETFAATFDKPGTCKLSLKAQHQLRAAVESNQNGRARYHEEFEERRKRPLNDSLYYSDWDGFHDLEGIESRILGERLQVLGSTMITVMDKLIKSMKG